MQLQRPQGALGTSPTSSTLAPPTTYNTLNRIRSNSVPDIFKECFENPDSRAGSRAGSPTPYERPVNIQVDSLESEEVLKQFEMHQVPLRDLSLTGRHLGEGAFGLVLEGHMKGPKGNVLVAVKTLKENANKETLESYIYECYVMLKLKVRQHSNVLNILGITSDPDGEMLLILEHCGGGCLLDVLHDNRDKRPFEEGYLSELNRINYAMQAARGLEHIHTCNIVHRDVAARNILLTNHNVVKVSDYGLTRNVQGQENSFYQMASIGKVPYRWLALESWEKGIYSRKSDVWMFGVLLWEIMTFGEIPYAGQELNKVLADLKAGRRLAKPPNCDTRIYALLLNTWAPEDRKRPNMKKVAEDLEKILEKKQNEAGRSPSSRRKVTDLLVKISPLNRRKKVKEYVIPHTLRAAILATVAHNELSAEYAEELMECISKGDIEASSDVDKMIKAFFQTKGISPVDWRVSSASSASSTSRNLTYDLPVADGSAEDVVAFDTDGGDGGEQGSLVRSYTAPPSVVITVERDDESLVDEMNQLWHQRIQTVSKSPEVSEGGEEEEEEEEDKGKESEVEAGEVVLQKNTLYEPIVVGGSEKDLTATMYV